MKQFEKIQQLDKIMIFLDRGFICPEICKLVTLKEDVDIDCLTKALEIALDKFPQFKKTLAFNSEDVVYVVNDKKPVIKPYDGSTYTLGTEETEGFLFVIAASGKVINTRIHHCLSDGRGHSIFLNALLYYYFQCLGKTISIEDHPIPLSEEECKPFGMMEYVTSLDYQPLGAYDRPEDGSFFHLVDNFFPADNYRERAYCYTIPTGDLIKETHHADSTPAPFLEACVSRAVQRAYNVTDKIIVGDCAFDMRGMFGVNNINNGAWICGMPYFPMMDNYDLEYCASLLKARLSFELLRDNIIFTINKNKKYLDIYDKIEASSPKERVVKWQQIYSNMLPVSTFHLSYVGKSNLPKDMEKELDDYTVYFPGGIFGGNFSIIDFNGKIQMTYQCPSPDERLAHEVYNVLKEYTPNVEFRDLGTRYFDKMDVMRSETI